MEQQEIFSRMPDLVSESIDQIVLPDLADGTRTAQQICQEMTEDATARIQQDNQMKDADQRMIDCWCVEPSHAAVLISYIQAAFDSWADDYGYGTEY